MDHRTLAQIGALVFLAVAAMAAAERGRPSRRESSPTQSPGPTDAIVASPPAPLLTLTETRPSTITCMESPGSPSRKMVVPEG